MVKQPKQALNFAPQAGKQELAFNIKVDVLFFGGSAGSGKSRLTLIKALAHAYNDPYFEGVIFRRTTSALRDGGGLFSEAKKLFLPLKPKVKEKDMIIEFNSTKGGNIKFTHLELESDAERNHQGKQYSFVGFDELCQFSQSQFLYLLGRLRSESRTDSFCMGTCNPDPDSWVLHWVEDYLDESGYPKDDWCGKVRYFVIVDDKPVFKDTPEEIEELYPDIVWSINDVTGEKVYVPPMSFAFINGTIFDNPALIRANPRYLSALKAQTPVNRARLLDGCWYARPQGSQYWQRDWCKKLDALPADATESVRSWDKSYCEVSDKNRYPDYTACIKMYKDSKGYYYVVGDFAKTTLDEPSNTYGRFRKRFGERNMLMIKQAEFDGNETTVVIPEESGAGKGEFEEMAKLFIEAGFRVKGAATNKNKLARFSNFSSASQNGFIYIIESSFPNKATLEAFYRELESFDGSRSTSTIKDDWVDACSDAFNFLQKKKVYRTPAILPINAPTSISGLSPVY